MNRPFRFQKCCQDFIGTHDETLSVAIQGRDAAPTPTGFAEIVGNDFPVVHRPITADSTPFAAQVRHGGFVLWRICPLQAVRSVPVGPQ